VPHSFSPAACTKKPDTETKRDPGKVDTQEIAWQLGTATKPPGPVRLWRSLNTARKTDGPRQADSPPSVCRAQSLSRGLWMATSPQVCRRSRTRPILGDATDCWVWTARFGPLGLERSVWNARFGPAGLATPDKGFSRVSFCLVHCREPCWRADSGVEVQKIRNWRAHAEW
jgi:hypothetical protein